MRPRLNPDAKSFKPTDKPAAPEKRVREPRGAPKSAAPKKKPAVCQFFLTEQGCKRGARCKFLHEAVAPAAAEAPKEADMHSVSAGAVAKIASGSQRAAQNDANSDSHSSSVSSSRSGSAPGSPSVAVWSCPFCSEDYNQHDLGVHLATTHNGEDASQVCPICAAMPGGDPSYRSSDIFGHFALRHGGLRAKAAGRGGGAPQPAGSMLFGGGGGPPGGVRANNVPKVVKTCHALGDGNAPVYSRGLDYVWEYAWRIDNGNNNFASVPCSSCHGTLALTETRAILNCGCTFHSGCVAPDTAKPACPICDLRDM